METIIFTKHHRQFWSRLLSEHAVQNIRFSFPLVMNNFWPKRAGDAIPNVSMCILNLVEWPLFLKIIHNHRALELLEISGTQWMESRGYICSDEYYPPPCTNLCLGLIDSTMSSCTLKEIFQWEPMALGSGSPGLCGGNWSAPQEDRWPDLFTEL